MSKRANVEQIQNNTLAGFTRTLNAERYRTEPNQLERTIAQSAKRREAYLKTVAETPQISVYNPDSALANFGLKSADEQRIISKRLKAQAKVAKLAKASI